MKITLIYTRAINQQKLNVSNISVVTDPILLQNNKKNNNILAIID